MVTRREVRRTIDSYCRQARERLFWALAPDGTEIRIPDEPCDPWLFGMPEPPPKEYLSEVAGQFPLSETERHKRYYPKEMSETWQERDKQLREGVVTFPLSAVE